MINLSKTNLSHSALYAFVAAVTALAMLFATFFLAEPSISFGQAADTSGPFTISQTITGENSFLVDAADVTMDGDIAGLTGGQATGSTYFVVQSNNAGGYYVDIDWTYEGNQAMRGEATDNESIFDYGGDVSDEPSFGFTSSTSAQFAYNVTASTSADVDQSFWNNGGTCNDGGGTADGTCWKAPTSTNFRIIDTTAASPTGATSTLTFSVVVPSGATPTVVTDTYTATATLSLYIK